MAAMASDWLKNLKSFSSEPVDEMKPNLILVISVSET
jgi:hypothetical protein